MDLEREIKTTRSCPVNGDALGVQSPDSGMTRPDFGTASRPARALRASSRPGPQSAAAAPVRARDRDRSLRPARPGRLAATVLVVGLVLLGAAAAEAQTTRALVSNVLQTNDDTVNTSGNDHAQLFHTGGHTGGYILTGVRVNSDDVEDDDFDVEVCEEDGSADEFPSTTASDCTALTAPSDFSAGLVFFTHAGLALSANTNYVVVIEQRGTGSVRLKSTTNTGEDSARPLGLGHQKQVLLEERQYLDD